MQRLNIKSIKTSTNPAQVYDLSVDVNHNFFIGDTEILTHNCDRLSSQAQDMLKSMTEEYSSVCRWIFTTNRPHMIAKPLQSRTQGFHVSSLDREQFVTKVASILIQEGVNVDESNWDILDSYVSSSYPDLRKCINLLQQNCQDGVLNSPSNGGSGSNEEVVVEAVNLFKKGKISAARQLLSGTLGDSDYEEVYRLLYRNLNWWGDAESQHNQAIVVIANRLRDHTLVADPEINLSACLVELEMIRNS